MSKTSEREWRKRREYLNRLANDNPKRICREWTKRLVDWPYEAKKKAEGIRHEFEAPLPAAFEIIGYVSDEIRACGEEEMKIEEHDTHVDMTDVCGRFVTKADPLPLGVEPNSFRLKNEVLN